MKKTFKINKITKQEIKEAISDVADEISSQDIFSDNTNDFANRANRRIIKAIRTAEECERAAAIARGNGDIASAEDLERRAKDLKAWTQNRWSSKSADENEKKHIESAKDEAEKAANEAKQSAAEAERDAREAESEAEKAEKEAAESDDSSKRQEAEAKREAANEAREAADEAKEAAKDARDAADEAADAVDEEDAKEAADRAKEAAEEAADAADKAREAKESAKESSEKSEGSSESEESSSSEDSDSEEKSGSSSNLPDAHTDSSSNSNDSSSNKSSSSSNSDDEDSDEESDGEESEESGKSNDRESEDEESDSDSDDKSEDEDSDGDSEAEDEEGDEQENGDEGEDSQSQSSNQSSKKPFKNPFDLAPRKAKSPMNQSNMKGKNDPDEEGDELDEIERMKRVLKMLRGGEKDGAIKALSDILDDKVSLSEENDGESSLVEAINSSSTIDQISDEEFDAIIDDSLKAIEKVKKLRKERSRADNIKKIDDLKKDNLFRHNLGAEDRTNIRVDTKKDTGQSEVQRLHNLRYYASSFKPSTAFKHDLLLAIQDQISTYKEQRKSWAAINRRTAHTSIMKQGTQHITQEEPKKPSIRVYLDCSSSFRKEDIEKEENFMQSIARFEKDGDIEKTVIKYFADDLWDDYQTARDQGGTSAWDEIIEDIKKYKPSNVVIVTDYDMYSQGGQYGTAEIDGIAWFIWKKYAAQSLINDIKCKKTIQYNLI